MGEFHRHPDGHVIIRSADRQYLATPDDFQRDYGVMLPPLPEGANEQVYTQGRRHAYMGDGNIIDGGPMPWVEGDAFIDAIQVGLDAMASRNVKPAPDMAQSPLYQTLFDYENRLRAIENKPLLTFAKFLKKVGAA